MQTINDDLEVNGTILVGLGNQNGVVVKNNNVAALAQKSPFGNYENIACFDNVDTLTYGPTQDEAHRIQQIFCGPVNYVKPHIHEDFIENLGSSLPNKFTSSPIGGGAAISYHNPSRLKLTTSASAPSNGIFITMNNMSLGIDAETQLHFCLNTDSRRNIDLQFGLQADNMNQQLRFRYASTIASDGTLQCTCLNGVNANTKSSEWNSIDGRRLFGIRVRKNGEIIFCAADSNNVLQTVATFTKFNPYAPRADAMLVPFLQFRTNDGAQVKTLYWDAMYLITEW